MDCVASQTWPATWLGGDPVSGGLVILSLVVTLGLLLGAIRVRGIRLGISGVLFSALLFGQIGLTIEPSVLAFVRDFSLVMFMYAIGLEVGPAFVSSFRSDGLCLNVLAVIVVALGAWMTVTLGQWMPHAAAVPGIYAGAFTTTAGLAAAQETLNSAAPGAAGDLAAARAALAYSITYPLGIVGPMLVIQGLRRLFRICIEQERSALASDEQRRRPPIESVDFELTEPAHAGQRLSDTPLLRGNSIILSRMLRDNVLSIPTGETQLKVGDIYRAVGPRQDLSQLVSSLGRRSSTDLGHIPGDIQRADLIVTRTQVLHRPLRDLNLFHRTGFTIAGVNRAGVDLRASGSLRLAFADRVVVVGPRSGLKAIELEFGNSPDTLNQPRLIPIFLGIVLGVVVGSIPLIIPGTHAKIRLGLAGGPLVIAILLSQLGSVGSIVWHMPSAASRLFRDFGLAVFLVCVGLQAGAGFWQRAATLSGAVMLLCGAAVTLLPVLLIACFARLVLHMNFITLSGWVAGTMGNSTILIFANDLTRSGAPAVAYAAVTPPTTLLQILLTLILAMGLR
jgi:putative transport protein